MTSDEDQPTQAEREAALFGPPGRGEYRRGDTLRFKDPQSGEHLAAKVIYVRAPAPAIKGGKVHPTVYMVYVQGGTLAPCALLVPCDREGRAAQKHRFLTLIQNRSNVKVRQ